MTGQLKGILTLYNNDSFQSISPQSKVTFIMFTVHLNISQGMLYDGSICKVFYQRCAEAIQRGTPHN